MELIKEIFEIIIGRIVVGFLGYYTMFLIYRITGNTKGIEWLKNYVSNEAPSESIDGGYLLGIVGVGSLLLIVYLISKVADFLSTI